MARRTLIAGNWKMNGSLAALGELDAIAAAARDHPDLDVWMALPATLIAPAAARVPALAVGAEDVHHAEAGVHTGCISSGMVKEAGARFTLVGHSERRADQNETNADVRAKADAAHRHGLQVILCVGETLAEREAGGCEAVVTAQLRHSLPDVAHPDWLVIAYEPVWAIGTGKVPTNQDVEEMHGAIRSALAEFLATGTAEAMRILYGGSVTGDNARELMGAPDVDGVLVGGASLTAARFVPIIAAGGAN